ncbi:hypothetical protein CBU02nite_23410 [Clostridium butyricum]|jgi:hypothetical protein|uniref:Uncharacterized protein n=1 Tax=Clostridium butyricum TaxID=1492 RepID=A0A512TNN1_CLOBU|nr:hypothetical protein [Clostridium butyricum]GEQ21835.1 hypothetical protein CBU02nite_23410 [Clostridium butyricum]
MMGFTEAEVRELILRTAHIDFHDNEIDTLIEELRKNYNEYLFSEDAEKRLFNSDMVLYYLKHYEDFGKGPSEFIDKNM